MGKTAIKWVLADTICAISLFILAPGCISGSLLVSFIAGLGAIVYAAHIGPIRKSLLVYHFLLWGAVFIIWQTNENLRVIQQCHWNQLGTCIWLTLVMILLVLLRPKLVMTLLTLLRFERDDPANASQEKPLINALRAELQEANAIFTTLVEYTLTKSGSPQSRRGEGMIGILPDYSVALYPLLTPREPPFMFSAADVRWLSLPQTTKTAAEEVSIDFEHNQHWYTLCLFPSRYANELKRFVRLLEKSTPEALNARFDNSHYFSKPAYPALQNPDGGLEIKQESVRLYITPLWMVFLHDDLILRQVMLKRIRDIRVENHPDLSYHQGGLLQFTIAPGETLTFVLRDYQQFATKLSETAREKISTINRKKSLLDDE